MSSPLTPKQLNIQRAADSARLVGGIISDVTRGYNNSYQASITNPNNNSRYDISFWDDGMPHQEYLLNTTPGQLVVIQIHAYNNKPYHPWKLYDIVNLNKQSMHQLTALDRSIKDKTSCSHDQLTALATRYDQLIQYKDALRQQTSQRRHGGLLTTVAGAVTAGFSVTLAPFTGGASLSGLAPAGLLLHNGHQAMQDNPTITHLQLIHQQDDLDAEWHKAKQLVSASLDAVQQLEAIINNAKLQPWKITTQGPAYGILPPRLKQDLLALANFQNPSERQAITSRPAAPLLQDSFTRLSGTTVSAFLNLLRPKSDHMCQLPYFGKVDI